MLNPKGNLDEYQVVVEGKTRKITELTREEAINELALAIDVVEDVGCLSLQLEDLVQKWRKGK